MKDSLLTYDSMQTFCFLEMTVAYSLSCGIRQLLDDLNFIFNDTCITKVISSTSLRLKYLLEPTKVV